LIRNQDIYLAVAGEPTFIEEAVKYTPPKKEPKPAAAPKAAAPKPAAQQEEEEEETPKVKEADHPLKANAEGVKQLDFDEWKRTYSNNDTRSVALPWFFENIKEKNVSVWKVEYKYNDELTLTFMSSNLIGGFFARLEASRKWIFGSMS
jgi:elongation factor 1-gamma